MSDSNKPPFVLEGTQLLASALHAQLLARRRPTFEHDLKNVIHGLMSGTELLNKALATSSPRITPAECLKLLQQQLGRTQVTLHGMLDEIAPPSAQATEIALSELLQECLHDVRHQLQRYELTSDIEPGLQIRAHRPLLKDVLLYLLTDAMDRAPLSSTFDLNAKRAGSDEASIELRYSLLDAARAPTSLTLIGEMLANDGIKTDVDIEVLDVRVGMRLPLVQARALGPAHRLLIVDANRDAADSLAMLAQLEGFDAHAAYDLESALQWTRARSPAALLVDADGSIDFPALVARIRSELSSLPRFIGLSHSAGPQNSALDAQFPKPLNPDALRRLLSD